MNAVADPTPITEGAFVVLVDTWSPSMLRVARGCLLTPAGAEEVVHDTWVAVIRGIDQSEGRSTLRTWTFRILANLARRRAARESRTTPWSSVRHRRRRRAWVNRGGPLPAS